MSELLEKLIQLARDWKAFSYESRGWSIERYIDGRVHCYFADGGGHSAVTFSIKTFSFDTDKIEVSFFNPETVNYFTLRSLDFIEEAIIEYNELLNGLKDEYAKRDLTQAAEEKQARVDSLKRQLAELEAKGE